MSTAVIFTALIIIVIFSIKSYCRKLNSGCCGGGDTIKKIKPTDRNISDYPYKKVVYIDGMTCRNCAVRVENAFNAKDGFFAKADLGKKSAEVMTKQPQDDELIKSIVQSSGYGVISVETIK